MKFLLLFILIGCHNHTPASYTHRVTFPGRLSKSAIYQAQVPPHWKHVAPKEQDLKDTILPIYAFFIGEGNGMRVTIHTFDQRISPNAQVERWKKQLVVDYEEIESYAHGGFGGLRFEAHGSKEGKSHAILGYSMQLTPCLYRVLKNQPEKRCDFTIKAVGTEEQLEKYRYEIDAFAESFELIEPIYLPG
jgi:hypothetical protein